MNERVKAAQFSARQTTTGKPLRLGFQIAVVIRLSGACGITAKPSCFNQMTPEPIITADQRPAVVEARGTAAYMDVCQKAKAGELQILSVSVDANSSWKFRVTYTQGSNTTPEAA